MNPFLKDHKQLSIFVTAGFPEINSLKEQIRFLQDSSIDFIEVGIPFSDPMADGPVIQETSSIALQNGMKLPLLFEQLQSIESTVPLVLMGYLNPVIKYGIEKFLQDCQSSKIASVILPDMSVEIYERLYQKKFNEYGVHPSFLITPTTDENRILKIAKLCSKSFVYLVSNNSTTGSSVVIKKDDLNSAYKRAKKLCGDTPLFIGFGIRSKSDVENVHGVADGAIIGSAYLKALQNNKEKEFIKALN